MKKNERDGFTLIEMMFVVSILGVLSVIGTMNYRFVNNRSKQSEAKAALGAAYDVMKNYASEFTAYSSRFDSIGYQPEGALDYKIGFGGDKGPAPGAPTGLGAPGASTCITTAATAANCSPGYTITWTNNRSATVAMVYPVDVPTESSFKVHALGGINNVTVDSWAIDQDKNLVNTGSGL